MLNFASTKAVANLLADRIRAEIVKAIDFNDPQFLKSGGEERGIDVVAPSLAGVDENMATSAGIDFSRLVTQPLRNSRRCQASLVSRDSKFTGQVQVSRVGEG